MSSREARGFSSERLSKTSSLSTRPTRNWRDGSTRAAITRRSRASPISCESVEWSISRVAWGCLEGRDVSATIGLAVTTGCNPTSVCRQGMVSSWLLLPAVTESSQKPKSGSDNDRNQTSHEKARSRDYWWSEQPDASPNNQCGHNYDYSTASHPELAALLIDSISQ
jgi:hypothetical protein